jgi:hypothetical protein
MLQVIRDNRTAKLYDGKRHDGMETAERPIDEMIELKNAAFASMDFPPTPAAWEMHSMNVSLLKQSSMFVEMEYKHKYDVDLMDSYNEGKDDGGGHDTLNKKKGSTGVSRVEQKQLIDEVLSLSTIIIEMPGRTLDPNQVWAILSQVTTIMTRNEEEVASIHNQVAGDEELLSGVYSEMQEVSWVSGGTGGSDDVNEENSMNLVPDDDAEDEQEASLEEEGSEDDGIAEADDETPAEEDEIEIGGKLKKVSKVAISKFANMDTYSDGRNKLEKLDLPLVRRRKQQREEREQQALHDNLFDFQCNIGSDFEAVMTRLDNALKENLQPGFGQRHSMSSELQSRINALT